MRPTTEPSNITATQLARSLSDVLNRVRYQRDHFIVVRNGEPIALIGPVASSKARRGPELARLLGDLRMPESFADDLEAIHAAQGVASIPEWPI